MEKVLRKECELPESVRIAKECGDVEALRRLGRIGAAKKARLKPSRDKAAKQKAAQALAQDIAHDAYVEQVLATEHARMVKADAHAHAMRNLVGWKG